MRHISKPALGKNSEEIFDLCASDFTKKDGADRLKRKLKPMVKNCSEDFDRLIPYNIGSFSHPNVSEEEYKFLVDTYDQKFARKDSIGRQYYDAIMINGGNTCPICELDVEPDTLDHFLPKKDNSLLSVTPENLVPTCYRCNRTKSAVTSHNYKSIPFHPYYEEITERWLECKICFYDDNTCKTTFYNGIDKTHTLWEKYEAQLKLFSLAKRYSIPGVSIINSIKRSHKFIFIYHGKSVFLDHLNTEITEEEKYNLNSYNSAVYRGIIRQIDEYCTWLSNCV